MTLNNSNIFEKKVAVIQSNYIPWAGYFAIMASVDLFVVYECVQYTKNDWRNRNQILEIDGRLRWLSIPIRQYSMHQNFMDTRVSHHEWAQSHYNILRQRFSRTYGWILWQDDIKILYEKASQLKYLFEINRLFLKWTARALGITTEIAFLDTYPIYDDPNERLISILKDFGANRYLSGPAAKSYLNPLRFNEMKIDLNYVNYNELIGNVFGTSEPAKPTSILQSIFEANHEFRCH